MLEEMAGARSVAVAAPFQLCGLPIGCWVRNEVEYGELFNEDVRESVVRVMNARW